MKAERQFKPARASVPAVRAFVLAFLAPLPPHIVDRVMLIVSELATNAVLHAKTDFGVKVEIAPSLLRIEVVDRGGGSPEVQPLQPPTAIHGRGLQIVDHLADRWGTVIPDTGTDKTIWVEVDVDSVTPAGRAPGSSHP